VFYLVWPQKRLLNDTSSARVYSSVKTRDIVVLKIISETSKVDLFGLDDSDLFCLNSKCCHSLNSDVIYTCIRQQSFAFQNHALLDQTMGLLYYRMCPIK